MVRTQALQACNVGFEPHHRHHYPKQGGFAYDCINEILLGG